MDSIYWSNIIFIVGDLVKIIKQFKGMDLYFKIITLISLILCALWVIFVKTMPFSDFLYYHNMAYDISKGGGLGDTYTTIGYAIVLGILYFIFGCGIVIGKIFNIILTLISCFALYNILNKAEIKTNYKKIIYTIYALLPSTIFYNSILCTEILFTAILLIIIDLYFSNNKYRFVFIGILTGFETMIKPFFLIFFLAVLIFELIKKNAKCAVKDSLIILIISLLTISPLIYRNSKYVGELTYVSNNGGIVLYINNNSENNIGRWMAASKVENSLVNTDAYKKANMTRKNKMLSSAAKTWIVSHPAKFTHLGFKRLYNTYFLGDDIFYSTNGAKLSTDVTNKLFYFNSLIKRILVYPAIIYLIVYTLIIIKSLFTKKYRELNSLNLFLTILFYMFTSVYFITEGQARYSYPIMFIFIYFFFLCIAKIYYLWRGIK